MEQDRAEIRLFFCSELYLPLCLVGWRHQVGHHRDAAACGVLQRRSLLRVSPGAAFLHLSPALPAVWDGSMRQNPSTTHHSMFHLCTVVLLSFLQLAPSSTVAFAGRLVSRRISVSVL